jgi:7-cyano-7-deazaguanine tRNA-ribosyltransferase
MLEECICPACHLYGLDGLKASAIGGFCNRATHNLWVLLEEIRWIEKHLADGTYAAWYKQRLDNSTYLPLID